MRIAYLILMHHLPEQTVRLVDRLSTDDSEFYIHVSRRSGPEVTEPLRQGLDGRADVHFLPRHRVAWGDFGLVRGMLEGVSAIARAGDFDYAVVLTGQDYPIRTNEEIAERLEQADGRSFLRHLPLPIEKWAGRGGLDRVERLHVALGGRRLSLPGFLRPPWERRLPDGMRPYGGSFFWCLERGCVEYLARAVEERPGLTRFFRHTVNPDEMFVATVLANSPLRDRLVNHSLTFAAWEPGESRPPVLTADDVPALEQEDALFARKFDMTVDERALDLLDSRLLAAR